MMNTLLEVNNLKIEFSTRKGKVVAVNGASFGIQKGEVLGIVGESGCGKSVTALSIMGLLASNGEISNGEIRLKEKEITMLSDTEMDKIRGDQVAMIFQDPMTSLNPVMQIGKQLMEPYRIHQKLSKKQAYNKAVAMLEKVGISSAEQRMKEYPHQFSGGMRQRIMIAMALACDPDLLIADEPTTALDVTIQAQVLDLIQELNKKLGTAIMLITHDMGIVADMADNILVMYAGKAVEYNEKRNIFYRPKHPYTQGLLKSIPSIETDVEMLCTIEGTVPAPGEVTIGCLFAPRCPEAKEVCYRENPPLCDVEGGNVLCWKYSGGGEYDSQK